MLPDNLPDNLNPNPVHHLNTPTAPPTPNSSYEPKSPAPVQITQNNTSSEKVDPPLVDVKVTNPVTYLKKWLGKLLKNQDIDIRIKIKPFATLATVAAFFAFFGLGYNFGLKSAAQALFPNSSPILHREITYQGTIQKTDAGQYFLSLPDSSLWALNTASPTTLTSLASALNRQALVKGNLTAEKNVIDVKEITPFDTGSTPSPNPAPSGAGPNQDANLPKLYSDIKWETDQKKTLLFTSGKRRIEQEGIYLESALLPEFPQDFINYYTQQLQNSGFKQTFNSSDPNGVITTYAKDDLFLTSGVKNIYSGSGDKKQLTGYRAYIEHN